jgi:phosphatidylinositol alpha-1,6-mannosyltransferase
MRKALLVTIEYPPQVGGVANYYFNLAKNLPVDKLEVFTNQNDELLAKRSFLPWLKAFKAIKKRIKEKGIEVILVGQILPLGTIVWLLSKYLKIPYIVFTHAMDITYPQKYPRKKILMQKILNSAEKIITVSRYTKYEIYKLLDNRSQRKIEIITPAPNITPNQFSIFNSQFSNKDEKIILSVGRLVARKGYDTVIKSLSLVLNKIPNIKYIIIGNGSYKETLQKLAQKLELQDRIEFKENLSDEQVAQYYNACDVFIMPSRETSDRDVEGFGLVYLEANSFGKPVIAGKSGGVEDAVIDGQTGFLVEPEDVNMVAESLIKILSNKDLAEKLGQQGRLRVEREFSWFHKARQLEKILQ